MASFPTIMLSLRISISYLCDVTGNNKKISMYHDIDNEQTMIA